ncbi:MAG: type II/IV secretion system ATPase subunit [Methanomassiliicoccales archaeon]|nr:MAG: type II/IV secretion system ATPase subunit [Methanomassiliicoccales archaeon]
MDDELRKQASKNEYLRKYLDHLSKTTARLPRYYETLSVKDLADLRRESVKDPKSCNFIYKVASGYIHINAHKNAYVAIEKQLTDLEKDKLRQIKEAILDKASNEESSETREDLERILDKLYDQVVEVQGNGNGNNILMKMPVTKFLLGGERIKLTKTEYELYKTFIHRDIVGFGPIEPLIVDQYIEDIHLIGTSKIRVSHKAFQYALETNIRFEDEISLNEFFVSLSERMGRPVSASKPIVDGTLPDGSRINIIYTNEISARGSSCTIRKFSSEPLSPVQLMKFGTFSPEMAAYIWLCLENKINIMICGETASGKTSTLNSILTFIDHRGKIYSVEDTPEVKPCQRSWQRCVTRESGPDEARVTMFDLLRAALRSRPDYIIIGEIRGEEARVAFQCMQTGIPVIATFHASTSSKFIQRMTGQPVNIPLSFIDNVNVIIFQSAVNVNGRFLRRVTHVEEIVGFNREVGGIMTRVVFKWDPARDVHFFRGMNNSHILENKVAAEHGYAEKKDIYKELKKREQIFKKMLELNITGYQEVVKIFNDYYEKGPESLPFR